MGKTFGKPVKFFTTNQNIRAKFFLTYKFLLRGNPFYKDEIRRCFANSPTSLPVFIHLAFDRYGWIPVPSEIPFNQFCQLKESCKNETETKILTGCYNHDENAIPPCYRLKTLNQITNWINVEPELRVILARDQTVEKAPVKIYESSHFLQKDFVFFQEVSRIF